MTAMRAFVGFFLLVSAAICYADPAVDSAQRDVDQAEKDLRKARENLNRARSAVEQNRINKEQYRRDLESAESKLAELQQQITSLEKQARTDHDALIKTKSLRDASVSDFTRAKKVAADKDREVEEAKKIATKKYESDPATLQLLTQINECKENVELQIRRIDTDLRKTEPYGKLRASADAAGEAVKQMRETPGTDSQALILANQKWMDSRSKADEVLDRALNRDPEYAKAVDLLGQSRKTYQDALSEFKKSLPEQPHMVVLIQAADQSKSDVINAELAKKKMDSSLREVELSANKSESKYKNVSSSLDEQKSIRDQAKLDLRQNQTDQSLLELRQRDAEIAIREAEIRLQRARQKLADAQQRAK